MGRVPRMPRIPPSRERSPTNTQSSSLSCSDPIGTQDTERHGEVEAGALLANVCRREVHGNVRRWDVVAAGAQRGADAILTLTDGGIRQSTVWKWTSFSFTPETSTSTSMILASIP